SCVYLPAALSGYLFAELRIALGWGEAALWQLSLLLIVPLVAMLFFDLSRTSCPIGSVPLAEAPVDKG
ncbi:MAG TPA: hypothetical protein PK677_15135, partial [Acidiphilium sp.]|nr:hypothetical protein [Acidiphilium sp.]